MKGEAGIEATEDGDEMVFPCSDGSFRRVGTVQMWRDQLKRYVSFGHYLDECLRTFVVEDFKQRFEYTFSCAFAMDCAVLSFNGSAIIAFTS